MPLKKRIKIRESLALKSHTQAQLYKLNFTQKLRFFLTLRHLIKLFKKKKQKNKIFVNVVIFNLIFKHSTNKKSLHWL